MTLLSRYIVRQNLFLIFIIIFISTGIYLLTDLFERLDNFLEAGLGAGILLRYFALKIPMIISQLMPAVFLLALVIQLNILDRSRELVALKAGGISPLVLVKVIVLYSIVWALAQFFFSQVAGVTGDRAASAIWQEDVQGHDSSNIVLKKLWFTEKNKIIHFGSAVPSQKRGKDVYVYALDSSGLAITEIIQAKEFSIEDKRWVLRDVTRVLPAEYRKEHLAEMDLPMRQDLKTFLMFERAGVKPAQMSLWELSDAIKHLERAGSNVEGLRTAWYGKIAYAASIVVMGLIALIISQVTPNVYKAVGLALLCVFLFHSANTICSSMGEKGLLTPMAGAWITDALALTLGAAWLLWPRLRRGMGG